MDTNTNNHISRLAVGYLQRILPKASASQCVLSYNRHMPWHGFKRAHSNYPWIGSMPVIYVKGSSYERGFQHGKQAKKLIAVVANAYKERYLTGNLYYKKEKLFKENLKRYEYMVKKVLGQEYLDEMRGISNGSGVPYEDILVIMARSELGFFCPSKDKQFNIEDVEHCISWSAWGKATAKDGGKMIATHNSEGNRWPGRNEIILVHQPTNGYRFMSPVFAGELAHHRGYLNEAGVYVSLSVLKGSKPEDVNFIPYCPTLRHIAQYASTAQKGFAMLQDIVKKGNFGAGATNIQIVDSSEAIYAQVTPTHLSKPLRPEMSGFVLSTDDPPMEEMLPYLTTKLMPSPKREGWLKVLRGSYGGIDVWHAMQIMGNHYNYGCGEIRAGSESLCIHGDYTRFTIGSIVALPEEKGMFIAGGNPCEANENNTWRYLSFDKPVTIADLPGLFVQGSFTQIITSMNETINLNLLANTENDFILIANLSNNNMIASTLLKYTTLPLEFGVSDKGGFIKTPNTGLHWLKGTNDLVINKSKLGQGPAGKIYNCDVAVVYVLKYNDIYILALFGLGYKGTLAACLYLSDYKNLVKLRGQGAILSWSDENRNGQVDMDEIKIVEVL